jgi:PAS domain S-box-containing protein
MNPFLNTLSLAMTSAPYGLVLGDEAGKILWVNKAFTQICDYELDEISGKTPGSFLHGPETLPATKKILRDAVSLRKACQCEILNYRKNGEPYWVALDLHFVAETSAHPDFFIAVAKEISSTLRQESELRREVLNLYSCVLSLSKKIGKSEL